MTAVAAVAPIVCSETQVVAVDRVGESFVRLVLAGPELWSWSADVVEPGTVSDAYIKLLVPPPGGPGVAPDPADIRAWLALPESERGWMRTYTVRRADSVEIDGAAVPALTIDVVVHPGEDEGPGSVGRLGGVGDTVRVIGPGRGHAPGARGPRKRSTAWCAETRPPRPHWWRSPRNWPPLRRGRPDSRRFPPRPTSALAVGLPSSDRGGTGFAIPAGPRASSGRVRLRRTRGTVLDGRRLTSVNGRRPWSPRRRTCSSPRGAGLVRDAPPGRGRGGVPKARWRSWAIGGGALPSPATGRDVTRVTAVLQ